MKIRFLFTVVAIAGAGALVHPGSAAQARAQPLACKMKNGGTQPINAQTSAPYLLTVTGGTSSNQNTARNSAQQAWSNAASASFGYQFAYWLKSTRQSVNCWTTKPNFQWLYTCRVTAQPCG